MKREREREKQDREREREGEQTRDIDMFLCGRLSPQHAEQSGVNYAQLSARSVASASQPTDRPCTLLAMAYNEILLLYGNNHYHIRVNVPPSSPITEWQQHAFNL